MGPAVDDHSARGEAASAAGKRSIIIAFSILSIAYVLLWSPHWYPLSDSALYLTLGRNLADGHGLTAPWNESRLSPPATPILIAAILKLGGGIGAIHAVNILLLLLAHWLCFLSLRNWVGPRAALAATLAAAAGFWTFQNAFTIMTEPLAMAAFWGALAIISKRSVHESTRMNTNDPTIRAHSCSFVDFFSAIALILLAVASRDAAILLLPGLAVLMLARWRSAPPRAKLIGAITFLLIFGLAFTWRYPEKLGLVNRDGDRFSLPSTRNQNGDGDRFPSLDPDDDAPNDTPSANRFKLRFLHDVPRNWRLLTDPPMLAGRWICESLAAPSWALFANKSTPARIASYILGYAVCAIFLIGSVSLIRARQYWALMTLLYFGVIFMMWGARIKPRYPAFIAPLIILTLAHGLSPLLPFVAPSLRRSVASSHSGLSTQHSGLFILATLIVALNLPTYAIELHIRRQTSRDFHDLARRGAYAPLIDIAAHLRKTTPPTDPITFNRGPDRRVAHRLIGRPILIIDKKIQSWTDPALIDLLHTATTRHAVLYVEHPTPTLRWPRWHWPVLSLVEGPINHTDPPVFYKLFERTPTGWTELPITPDRAYLHSVPPAP